VIHRRELLRALLLAAAAPAAFACGPDDYTDADRATLDRRIAEGRAATEHSAHRYAGYAGLAQLPYFDLDPSGRLRLAVSDLPPAIDMHAHLAIGAFLAPRVDLQKQSDEVRYFLSCPADRCTLDLESYLNEHFSDAGRWMLRVDTLRQLLDGGWAAKTHTIPNLIDEMDRCGIAQSAALPFVLGVPFRDDLADWWMDEINAARASARILAFASVHPDHPDAIPELRRLAARGARGVKLHPEVQRFFPDSAPAMAVYEECQALGLPVIFHAGRSGLEAESWRKYALIRRFAPAARTFPKLPFLFGHGGARDVDDAIELARQHPNVLLETASLGVSALRRAKDSLGHERIVFGTDWPWYPQAVTLAKVLILTEGDDRARHAILRGNAETVLEQARVAAHL
jgi:uncharacterized protein